MDLYTFLLTVLYTCNWFYWNTCVTTNPVQCCVVVCCTHNITHVHLSCNVVCYVIGNNTKSQKRIDMHVTHIYIYIYTIVLYAGVWLLPSRALTKSIHPVQLRILRGCIVNASYAVWTYVHCSFISPVKNSAEICMIYYTKLPRQDRICYK